MLYSFCVYFLNKYGNCLVNALFCNKTKTLSIIYKNVKTTNLGRYFHLLGLHFKALSLVFISS